MARTTPPRPFTLATEIPEVAGLARTATRLHPRPGLPTVHDSSVGGPLLWPAEEPWPVRTPAYRPRGRVSTLADIHTRRNLLTDAWARPRGPHENLLTEEEREITDRINAGHLPELMPEGPLPLIPVAQFYARDVPALPFPEGTDLLQILWAPFDDIEGCSDAVQLRWRLSSDVTEALTAPPEPPYVTDTNHVPSPCVLHPEEVQEFPPPHLLNEEQDSRVTAWVKARSADYRCDLSIAPGWKLGGWPAHFTFRDPAESNELHCGECHGPVEALLTIDSSEWDGDTGSWRPTEDARRSGAPLYRTACEPTLVNIGRGYTLQFYSCTGDPSHLPRTIMQ